MGFLAEFDAAPAGAAQVAVVVKWLRSDWRGMYGELRANRPILATPLFTLVTRATDVLDVLAQPSLYSVRANRISMDPAVGPFMLARDETEINWQEKGLMQSLLRWNDLPRVRTLAAEVADAAIAGATNQTLDIVPAIGRAVPLRIVQDIFGFKADDADLLRWSFATQHGMFRNLTGDPQVLAACHEAGQQMQAWLWPFLAAKWASAPSGGQDSVSRLIDISIEPAAGISTDRVLSNVCGLLVGSIETMSQAIVNVVDQFLAHPDWLAAARAADAAGNRAAFDAHVFEALRYNPITTIQFRTVEADRTLAQGTPYATPVKAGSVLAVCTGSAMFDADLMPDPEQFDPTRSPHAYLHFGLGHHECLGRHVGQVAIPEAVRQIIQMTGLERVPGPAGQVDFAGGPFPEHLQVRWVGRAPVSTPGASS